MTDAPSENKGPKSSLPATATAIGVLSVSVTAAALSESENVQLAGIIVAGLVAVAWIFRGQR